MKNITNGFLIACTVGIFACNQTGSSYTTATHDSTSSMANDTTGNKMDTTKNVTGTSAVDDASKKFAAEAATGGMMEVELGKIAEQNAKSHAVKNFGKMMVDDHTTLNNNMKTLATSKNIDLPATVTDDQRKDIDKISKSKGPDFDKEYVNMMVEDHKKDIASFKKAQADVTDNDFKNFITTSLPVLQKHLDAIQNIKSKM